MRMVLLSYCILNRLHGYDYSIKLHSCSCVYVCWQGNNQIMDTKATIWIAHYSSANLTCNFNATFSPSLTHTAVILKLYLNCTKSENSEMRHWEKITVLSKCIIKVIFFFFKLEDCYKKGGTEEWIEILLFTCASAVRLTNFFIVTPVCSII